MLKTCSHFVSTHSLIFNANKTPLVRFSHSNFRPSTLSMQVHVLRWSEVSICETLGTSSVAIFQRMKTFPPSRRISLAKLTACCTPFPVVIHSLKLCFFAVFASQGHSQDVVRGFCSSCAQSAREKFSDLTHF
jgi:hypothetical protein